MYWHPVKFRAFRFLPVLFYIAYAVMYLTSFSKKENPFVFI